MTSLPIHIPPGFQIVVKKGDVVTTNQILAQKLPEERKDEEEKATSGHVTEIPIDVPSFFAVSIEKSRSFVRKSPGDTVIVGEVLASRSSALGTKREDLISQISGIVSRFERDTGRLVIRTEAVLPDQPAVSQSPETIISPLDGTVTLCNNDEIVLETKTDALPGVSGVGKRVQGELVTKLFGKEGHQEGESEVTSSHLTAELIGKIVLVEEIGREALAKASAMGVMGIIATHITVDDLSYLQTREIDLSVVEVDETIAKKLVKASGKVVVLDGLQKTIMIGE